MLQQLLTLYRRHHNFILLVILFITFRALTLLAYRPGGLVLDFSDFYWYREFAQLTRQGYYPYDNLWTTYPPLFPWLMLRVWQVSTLLPPWEFSNLWFTLLLGGVFLLFEIGNFIILYLLALKLYPQPDALKPIWIYATFFVPVYTITGWFESYPFFFFLLSLYLLLQKRPYLSAFFSGVGFMIKLIPLILLPVGVQLLPIKGGRFILRWPALNVEVDVGRALAYTAIFGLTVLLIGFPFYQRNPDLILGSIQITSARLPWETVWALLEGNYDYGVIPLDMRNLAWQPGDSPTSTLPWLWITAVFGLIYTFLYTRRIDWRKPRPAIAFTAFTVCLFFLYSKGYSPQWLVWPLFFIALLLPNLRGVWYATILSITNMVEANLYFIMFPEEHWLLATTISLRTALLIILAGEFCLLIWPQLVTPRLVQWRRIGLGAGTLILLFGLYPAFNQLGQAYSVSRLAQSPYQATIMWLQEQPVKEAILLNQQPTYDWFYPYLRSSHQFYMLDDYADETTTVAVKTESLLTHIQTTHQAIWLYDSDPNQTTPAETVALTWLSNHHLAHQADIDGGRLYLYLFNQP